MEENPIKTLFEKDYLNYFDKETLISILKDNYFYNIKIVDLAKKHKVKPIELVMILESNGLSITSNKIYSNYVWENKKLIFRPYYYTKRIRRYITEFKGSLFFDNMYCSKCKKENTLSIDHIIPKSKDGEDILTNFQILCKSCNSSKGNKTIEVY